MSEAPRPGGQVGGAGDRDGEATPAGLVPEGIPPLALPCGTSPTPLSPALSPGSGPRSRDVSLSFRRQQHPPPRSYNQGVPSPPL